MTAGILVGQETGRTRARDLLPGDIVPEVSWAEITDISVSPFGLIGIETTAGDDLRAEPDRLFHVAYKATQPRRRDGYSDI